MMIVGAGIVLTIVNPVLALYTAVSMPAIGLVAWLFAHKVHPISREVQERKGDVTEAADEAVVGIEMVQAFGREDDVRERFGGKATAVRDTVLRQAGVESRHLPGLFFLPSLSVAVVLWFGGGRGISGALASGRFPLLNLLPRFYDPTHGRVLLGGVDVREITLEELRRAVALVTQKPILFSVPLRENLLTGRPDAPWEEVLAAAEASGVARFAEELPE